ncbi:DUF445 domain-containing protein [Weeksellaceae bacterium TAE3-ERU29]|nr:DUF445 domain-containing protein [Weeksellaceae bacterium TAE3-ERU29]
MNNKKRKLRFHKAIATGLFLLMALVYIGSLLWQKRNPELSFLGYIKAFSEAAMVGALADWFAVTALFNKPLGLPIPHTNIIENRKNDIGDNLGTFVVENFLNPENIRPYIKRLSIASHIGKWLKKERNTNIIVEEVQEKIIEIIDETNDEKIITFISDKSTALLKDIKIHLFVSDLLLYVSNNKEHQRLLNYIFDKIQGYISENEEMIKDRVRQESSSFIPSFVDDILAKKITAGLNNYFKEISENPEHSIRIEIDNKINQLIHEISTESKWKNELDNLKNKLLSEEKITLYSKDLWEYIKGMLLNDLKQPLEDSSFKSYLKKSIIKFANQLDTDLEMQEKIDKWLQKNAYKYILKNRGEVGNLISATVGNWQGRELSEKLELEVGKDLQFIRVNGTLVGGLVGLIIYTITHLFL